jgi:hypothetical protein
MRLVGGAALVCAGFLYFRLGGGWGMAAVLLLAPDLAFIAFAMGVGPGVMAYNAVHRPMVPLVLLVAGFAAGLPILVLLSLIWVAHIGMDRAAGYGLREVAATPDPGSLAR